MGNLGCLPGESQLQKSQATQPMVHAGCLSVSIIHQTLTWVPDLLHAHRCKCMQLHRWVYGHGKRVCTESWLWEKNLFLHDKKIKPAIVACQSDALPTEVHPHRRNSSNSTKWTDSVNSFISFSLWKFCRTHKEWPSSWQTTTTPLKTTFSETLSVVSPCKRTKDQEPTLF